jgi:hypothetical protein
MTVVGLQYGQWGIDNYGNSPTRVEALSFYPDRLKALLEEIRQAQDECLPPNEQVMPAAFVTFYKRKCQVASPPWIIPLASVKVLGNVVWRSALGRYIPRNARTPRGAKCVCCLRNMGTVLQRMDNSYVNVSEWQKINYRK